MKGNTERQISSIWMKVLSVLMAALMFISIGNIAFSTITHGATMSASDLRTLLAKGGNVTLTNNITCSSQLEIKKSTNLYGKGYTITFTGAGSGNKSAIYVTASANIYNLNLVAKAKGFRAIRSDANLDFCGGSIKDFDLNPDMSAYDSESQTNIQNRNGGGILFYSGGGRLRGGAEISGCRAIRGGGVACSSGTLTINGAYIHNNRAVPSSSLARGYGGGVAAMYRVTNGKTYSATINILCATISNNTARIGGGGIYVDGDENIGGRNSAVNLYNAVVTGNESTGTGGGIQSCYETDRFVVESNSLAIYGNKSKSGYGPDLAFEQWKDGTQYSFSTKDIAGNAFKNAAVYRAGKALSTSTYSTPASLKPLMFSGSHTPFAYGALRSEVVGVNITSGTTAKEINSLAAVRITDNTAGGMYYGNGGGIFCNGVSTFSDANQVRINKLVTAGGVYTDKGQTYPFKITWTNNNSTYATYRIYAIDKDGNVGAMVSRAESQNIIQNGDTINLKAYQCAIIFGLNTGTVVTATETNVKGATSTMVSGSKKTTATFDPVTSTGNQKKTFINEYSPTPPPTPPTPNTYPGSFSLAFYKQASDYSSTSAGTSLKGTYTFTFTGGYNSAYSNAATSSMTMTASLTADGGRQYLKMNQSYNFSNIYAYSLNTWYYYKLVETAASPQYVGVNNSPIYVRVLFNYLQNKTGPIDIQYSSDKVTWKSSSTFTFIEPSNSPRFGRLRISKTAHGDTDFKARSFNFELRGNGLNAAASGSIKYKIHRASGSTTAEQTATVNYTAAKGYYVSIAGLKTGDYVEFYNLPLGYSYAAAETTQSSDATVQWNVLYGAAGTVFATGSDTYVTQYVTLSSANTDTGTPAYTFSFDNFSTTPGKNRFKLYKFVDNGIWEDYDLNYKETSFKFTIVDMTKSCAFYVTIYNYKTNAVVTARTTYTTGSYGFDIYLKNNQYALIEPVVDTNYNYDDLIIKEYRYSAYQPAASSCAPSYADPVYNADSGYEEFYDELIAEGLPRDYFQITPPENTSGSTYTNICFLNRCVPEVIEVTKKVIGASDSNIKFTLKLTTRLLNGSGDWVYFPTGGEYIIYNATTGNYKREGTISDDTGTFKLGNNERAVIYNCSSGYRHFITEVGTPYYSGLLKVNGAVLDTGGPGEDVFGDAGLIGNVEHLNHVVELTNTFNPEEAPETGQLKIEKAVTETGRTADQFKFTVTGPAEMTETYNYKIYTNGVAGGNKTIKNKGIITLKANQYAIIEELPFGTYTVSEAGAPNYIGHVVAQDYDTYNEVAGELNSAISAKVELSLDCPDAQAEFLFTNEFQTVTTSFSVIKQSATDTLNGDTFTFNLYDANNNVIATGTTKSTMDDSDEVNLVPDVPIVYDTAGTYKYTIKEVKGEDTSWIYNTGAVINVTVVVTQGTDGLEVTRTYSRVENGVTTNNNNTIVNTIPTGIAELQVQKFGANNAILDKEFQFEANPCTPDGVVMADQQIMTATSKPGSNSDIAYFDKIESRTETTLFFAISEVPLADSNWDCDRTVIYAKIQFIRDGDNLNPIISYGYKLTGGNISEPISNIPSFTNYRTGELNISKKISGGSVNDSFSFTISSTEMAKFGPYTYYKYDDGNPTAIDSDTVSNNGTVSIKANQSIKIVGLPEGTYTVTEAASDKYSSSAIFTDVTNGKKTFNAVAGTQLVAQGTVSSSGSASVSFAFTNTQVPGVAIIQAEKVGQNFILDKEFEFIAEECDRNGNKLTTAGAYSSTVSSKTGTGTYTVTFKSIIIEDTNPRYFIIRETTTSGGGYICDNTPRYAVVVGNKGADGKISTNVSYGTFLLNGGLTLESTDAPKIVNRKVANMQISKSFKNNETFADDFEFKISSSLMVDARGYKYDVFNKADDSFVGTGYVTQTNTIPLKANQYAIISDLTVGEYTVTELKSEHYSGSVTVTKAGSDPETTFGATNTDLSAKATLEYTGSVSLVFDFENEWHTSVDFKLEANKSANGKILDKSFEFAVYLLDQYGTNKGPVPGVPPVQTGTGGTTKHVEFNKITYTQPGKYYYVITETVPNEDDPRWITSGGSIYACVTVEYVSATDHNLKASVVYGTDFEDEKITGVVAEPTISNTKLGELTISKTVDSTDTAGKFYFTVTGPESASEGTYHYKVYASGSSTSIRDDYIELGHSTLYLEHNQYATIEGLPEGNYTVTEQVEFPYIGTATTVNVNGEYSTPNVGLIGENVSGSAIVDPDANTENHRPSVDFVNTRINHDLMIKKNIFNSDVTKRFTFKITSNKFVAGTIYDCYIYNNANPDSSIRYYEITSTKGTIELSGEEFAVMRELPVGTYTVTETANADFTTNGSVDPANGSQSVPFTSTSASGEILDKGTHTLTFNFNNTEKSSSVEFAVNKSGGGSMLDKPFEFTLYKSNSSGTQGAKVEAISTSGNSVQSETLRFTKIDGLTGTKYYMIKETTPSGDGWTNPGTIIYIKVVVKSGVATVYYSDSPNPAANASNQTVLAITNKKSGELKIMKSVVDGSTTDEFNFTVTSPVMADGVDYTYIVYNKSGAQQKTGTINNTSTSPKIPLKATQYAIVSGLPLGTYTVTEAKFTDYIATATVTGSTLTYNGKMNEDFPVDGTIDKDSNTTLTFSFENTKNLQKSAPMQVNKVGKYANLDKKFTFELYKCDEDMKVTGEAIEVKTTSGANLPNEIVTFDGPIYNSTDITEYPYYQYFYIVEKPDEDSDDGWLYNGEGVLVRQTVTKTSGVLNVVTEYATDLGSGELTSYGSAVQDIENLKVGNLRIEKTAINGKTGEKFKFTVSNSGKDSAGNDMMADIEGYPYKVYDKNDAYVSDGVIHNGDTENPISLEDGQYAIIEDLPVGGGYKVTEVSPSGYKPSYTVSADGTTLSTDTENVGQSLTADVTVTASNTPIVTCSYTNERELQGSAELKVQKVGDNSNLDRQFEFKLFNCDPNGNEGTKVETVKSEIVDSKNYTVAFSKIPYTTADIKELPAYKYYVMYETDPASEEWIGSDNRVYAMVTITKGQDAHGDDILATSVSYGSKLNNGAISQPTETPNLIINTKLGSLIISKDSPNATAETAGPFTYTITSPAMLKNEYTYNVYSLADDTVIKENQKITKGQQLQLNIGEYAKIIGLEYGEYTVTEDSVAGFKPSVNITNPESTENGTTGSGLTAVGIVSKNDPDKLRFEFTNTKSGNIKILKTVPNAEVFDEFVFTVSTENMIDGVDYEYFVYDIGGTVPEKKTGVINKTNSTISFTEGKEVLIKDLPIGSYSVTESGTVGYIGSVQVGSATKVNGTDASDIGDAGTVSAGATLTFTFENEKENNGKGFLQIKKLSKGSVLDKQFRFFMVECDKDGTILTGGETDTKDTILGADNSPVIFKEIQLTADGEIHYYMIYEENADQGPDADSWIRDNTVIYAKLEAKTDGAGLAVNKVYGTKLENGVISGNPSEVSDSSVISLTNKKVGDMLISKDAVNGKDTEPFTFNIASDLLTAGDTYEYFVYNKGEAPGTTATGTIPNSDNVSSITILRNQCVLIKNLLTGKYEVTETGVEGYRATVSVNGGNGITSEKVGESVTAKVDVAPGTMATVSVAFTNKWTKVGEASLIAKKNVFGGMLDKQFEFTAAACDANGNAVRNGWIQTIKTDVETSLSTQSKVFDSLPQFENEGLYYFRIDETIETGTSAGGWQYDTKTVYAIVDVKDDTPADSKELSVTVTYGTRLEAGKLSGNESADATISIPFVNKKVGDLEIRKTTENGSQGDKFTFIVTSTAMDADTMYRCDIFNFNSEDDKPYKTDYLQKNENGDGTVTISADQYVIIRDLPLGTYTVTEVGQGSYTGEVTVTQNDVEGELKPGVKGENLTTEGVVVIGDTVSFAFKNTKTQDDKAQFHITKIGSGSILDRGFKFNLTQCDKNGGSITNPHKDTVTSETGATTTTVMFPQIVTYTTEGDYFYYIKEEATNSDGWLCDTETIVYVKVTVHKEGDKVIADAPIYGTSLENGVISGDTSASITNERRGSLKISKTLRDGDMDMLFKFKIESTVMVPEFKYLCEIYNKNGTEITEDDTIVEGSITSVAAGDEIFLKTGQYIIINNLPSGTYKATEFGVQDYEGSLIVTGADGVSNSTKKGFENIDLFGEGDVVPGSEKILTFDFTNKQAGSTPSDVEFEFYKTTSDLETTLEGAEFKLYTAAECTNTDENHRHDMTLITDNGDGTTTTTYYCAEAEFDTSTSLADGLVKFSALSIDKPYLLVETRPPEGYKLPKGAWLVTIDDLGVPTIQGDSVNKPTAFAKVDLPDSDNNTYTIYKCTNAAYLINPTTGGFGTIALIVGGSLLMIAAIALFIIFMRKKSREDVKDMNQKRRGEE